MTVLLLKGYNNYFNRIVKIENDISSYKTASTSYLEYANVNFDPQDGILTSLVVGSEGQLDNGEILQFDSLGTPDYLIVHEGLTINSRWFIVESVKTTAGQYKLALKRDVLVDFNEQVMNSPCYVEKGMINDLNSALLLNSEGSNVNQIKTSELSLRDKTDCAWLVGYLKKNLGSAELDSINPITYAIEPLIGEPLENIINTDCVTFVPATGNQTPATKKPYALNNNDSTVKFRTYYLGIAQRGDTIPLNIRHTFNLANAQVSANTRYGNSDWDGLNSVALKVEYHNMTPPKGRNYLDFEDATDLANDIYKHTFNWGLVTQYYNIMLNTAKYNKLNSQNYVEAPSDIMSYNGQTVYYNNKYWTLVVGSGSTFEEVQYFTGNDNVAVDYFSNLYYETLHNNWLYYNAANPGKNKVKITFKGQKYTITAIEKAQTGLTYSLPYSINRNTCSDALYDMFAIPVNPAIFGIEVENRQTRIGNGFNNTLFNLNQVSDYELAIATLLCTKLGAGSGTGALNYDLQLLPYCPMDLTTFETKDSSGNHIAQNIDIHDLTEGKDYSWIIDTANNNAKRGIVFYPKKANKTTDINISIKNNVNIENKYIGIIDPVFHTEVTNYPNQGDIARDPEGNPLLYYTFPYKCANRWNDPAIRTALTKFPAEAENYLAEDGVGVNLEVDRESGSVTVYFSFDQADAVYLQPTMTFKGELGATLDWIIPDTPIDKKVKNECDFYRLVSPNYNGMFEFKLTKLNTIGPINVDLTFKPFTPYIKLNPNFQFSKYMNKDYNDSTGLICNGDFSIPMITDAFTNYELSNKNYQAIFSRQIQNLDVNNKIAKEQLDYQGLIGTIAGGVAGSAQGLATGMKTGNPYVAAGMAIAGGVAGNVLGGVGWAKDRDWLERQQGEARSFSIDQYQLNLGNIQALPQSVTKSSPLSYNNKIWPILEYFTCTDEEKAALRNRIKYTGMTVMAIGTLKDYSAQGAYVKGQMIRINNLNDDSHIAQAIYEEVNKGFYEGENE